MTLVTPLKAWYGDVTLLDRKLLMAEDADSGPETLLFIVTYGLTNGHLAKVDQQSKPIGNFTQLDINRELIVFVHGGEFFILLRLYLI